MRAALAVALALALLGCAPMVEVHAAHLSQPYAGPYGAPVGDHGDTDEISAEVLGVAARWQSGLWFTEVGMDYAVRDSNFAGGPWLFGVKVGVVLFGAE